MNKFILALLVVANILVIVGVAHADGTVQVCDASMTHCTSHVITTRPAVSVKGSVVR